MKFCITVFLLVCTAVSAGPLPEDILLVRQTLGSGRKAEASLDSLINLPQEKREHLLPFLSDELIRRFLGSEKERERAADVFKALESKGFSLGESIYRNLEHQMLGGDLRFKAVDALVQINSERSVRIFEDILLHRWESGNDASRSRKRKLDRFKESMNKIRAKAAEGLSLMKSEGSVPLLMNVLREEKDIVVREYVLKALLSFDDSSILPLYEKTAVEDESPKNRILGIAGMTQYPDKVKSQIVKTVFGDENVMVRLAVIKFLVSSGRNDLTPFISASAHDSEKIIKRRIAELLGSFNTETSCEILKQLARDPDPLIRTTSITALGSNTHFSPSSYLEFCSYKSRLRSIIILKSVFNSWRTAIGRDFEKAEVLLGGTCDEQLEFSKRKIRKRKRISGNSREREKIKLILTEVQNKCKL